MQKLQLEIKKRFLEEISALKESKNTISEKIGVSDKSFNDIIEGNGLSGLLILGAICRTYPFFDSTYVITGVRREEDCEALRALQADIYFKKMLLSKFG